MSLVTELKRRNVFRVAAAYLVVGWLLTEVLTTILPTLGAPEWMPRAIILAFAFGFIPMVVLSWIYELTPEGIKREKDVDRDSLGEQATVRKLDYLTISAVALIIVFAAFFSASTGPDGTDIGDSAVSNESVAVLPFVNMSNDEDNDYFSDGLTETLLHMLAQIPDLNVAARTSSFAFKGQNIDVKEIARALQVAHVLEGSVQQVGDRVRITAQLIRAADGFHVWSEKYDRTMDDIFKIQDEIAMKVGSALSASLLGAGSDSQLAGVDTENPDAYDMYLQALRERATYSYGGLLAAEELLKGALTVDPDFLDAKTELSAIYLHQFETGLMDFNDAFSAVRALVNQVLAVRPDDASARAIRLFVDANPHTRRESPDSLFSTIEQLETIIREHPDEYQGRVLLTRILQDLRQFDRALQLQLRALDRDPFNARIHYEVGSLYLELGRIDDARAALQKSLDIEPLQPNAYLKLALAARYSGDGVEFLRQNLKAMEVDPRDHEIPGSVAIFLYELGLIEAGDDFRNLVIAVAPTSEIAYRIDLMRAMFSGDDEAGDAAARRTIEDDIDDRNFAYAGAVQYLMRAAARDGTVEAESAWLEQQAPGIFDIEAASLPAKYRISQRVAFDAWFTMLPRDALLDRLEKAIATAELYGRNPLSDPDAKASVLAMQGQTEQAIQVALAEAFRQPVLLNMNWKNDYAQAQFREVVEDARIQAAMRKRENSIAVQKERVETYLVDLSAAS